MIYPSMIHAVGNTPIVHLQRFSKSLGFNVFAKLESLNPGGSHKVRIALGMIRDAEQQGILRRGSGQTIIEPSGGNTGIGLAIAANLLGYHLVLVIPDNYSREKQKLLRLYGAEVVLSDSRLGNNSHGVRALELQLEKPHYVMLNQQRNPANPQTHRDQTALEILADFEDTQIDLFIAGIGTGGHITGVGEVLRETWPRLTIYGVEPEGCDLFTDRHAPHGIQGLSIGIVPSILNTDLIDAMVKVNEQECLDMARQMLQQESISMGLSSAANFAAIAKLGKGDIPPGTNVLTMVYDGIESYLDYFGESDQGG
ncbi:MULTISPECIES: PLP-dependent cysteine synthase family protein [Marinobacter]|uniref:PLP-dependent cysteine synthase family protein n=1 Tax=Marinobacter TaxID=2742 RepID=UPI001D06A69F|nr:MULTISPECIES: cysteine synthase family protein [Marinobacter]MCK7567263.1 cysteine synthase family protein [Marinobacter xestospongiae]UDL04108.1 cysteine synthase family protein [Marinobacter sp. CA1]